MLLLNLIINEYSSNVTVCVDLDMCMSVFGVYEKVEKFCNSTVGTCMAKIYYHLYTAITIVTGVDKITHGRGTLFCNLINDYTEQCRL